VSIGRGCHFRGPPSPQSRAPVSCLLSTDPAERETGLSGLSGSPSRCPSSNLSSPAYQRLTLGLKAESLNIASHHRTLTHLRYPPQRSFSPPHASKREHGRVFSVGRKRYTAASSSFLVLFFKKRGQQGFARRLVVQDIFVHKIPSSSPEPFLVPDQRTTRPASLSTCLTRSCHISCTPPFTLHSQLSATRNSALPPRALLDAYVPHL
jgi:hypothetical protein